MNIAKVEFTTYLDTREIADKVWELLNDFVCLVHTDDKTYQVIISKGFVTDYASVPRIPFAYLLYGGLGNYPAVLHDGLYGKCKLVDVTDFDTKEKIEFTREQCDEIFYLGLLERGISKWKALPMYWGVRMGGGSHYKKD